MILRFLPDTSCLVAALCSWREHQERVARELERRLDGGETLVVAAPELVETCEVLTRLPSPHRLSPADSLALLEANFMGSAVEVVAQDGGAYASLLRGEPGRGIAGGRTYDAVIVGCAAAAGANVVLTFNERQFSPLADQGIQVVVPA